MSGIEVEPPLARAAVRGVAWSFLATAAARILTLVSLMILARLLAPADFGLLAFALVFITYAESVGDLGTAAALVYWPERTDEAARVTFAVNAVLGLAWLGLTLLAAPFVATFFGNPAGEDILRALAWSFPLKYLGNAHDALCQKSLRFRARLVPELGMAVVKAAVSIVLAASGFGVWGLVWGQLLGQATWTLLLWVVVPWRPRGPWPGDLLRPMLAYGRGIVAVNVLAAITHHADLVVVGRMLGAAPLGLYQMAAKVPETTVTLLLWVTSRVLFPAFSRVHSDGGRLSEGYLAAARYVSLVTLPAAAGLAVLAEPVVLVAFGEAWRDSVPVLRGLALYAAFRSLSTPAGDVLKAMGRPGLLAGLGLLRALVLVPALVLAARSGTASVALALAAVTGGFTVVNVAAASRLAGVSAAALLRALGPSLVATLTLVVVLLACANVVAHAPSLLIVGAVLGSGASLAAVRISSPETWRDALANLREPPAPGPGTDGLGEAGRFLVPLRRGIVRFYVENLHVPHGLRERALALLAQPGLTSILWTRRVSALGAVGEAGSQRQWDALLPMWASVADDVGAQVCETSAAPAWCPLLQRDDAGHSLVVLLFPPDGTEPAAVAKLRRRGAPGSSLAGEADVLARLAERLPDSLRRTIPRVLDFRVRATVETLLLSALPGRPIYVEMQASLLPLRRAARHLDAVGPWLAAFHQATRSERRFDPAAEESAMREAAVEAGEMGGGAQDLRWYDGLRAGLERRPLPLAAAHGDFWSRNVLLDRAGRVTGVVDWEHASPGAPPFVDLFHFALTYGRHTLWSRYRRCAPESAFRWTFLADTPISRAVREYLRSYCAATGWRPELLEPLFRFYLWTGFRRAGGDAEKGLWLRFDRMLAKADRSVFSG